MRWIIVISFVDGREMALAPHPYSPNEFGWSTKEEAELWLKDNAGLEVMGTIKIIQALPVDGNE